MIIGLGHGIGGTGGIGLGNQGITLDTVVVTKATTLATAGIIAITNGIKPRDIRIILYCTRMFLFYFKSLVMLRFELRVFSV
jgi:hypothetical protein